MDIKKYLISTSTRAIAAFAVIAVLAFPSVSKAVSIGEIVLQSKLGEPLLAQVDLTLGSGEQIETSCLSLVAPDPSEEDISGYLTRAYLSVKTDGKRQYVAISSHKLFNDAFARLRLQIQCPGLGKVIKTLTILPDLDASAPQAQIAATNAVAETANTSVPPVSNDHEIAPEAKQRNTRDTLPDVNKYLTEKAAGPTHKRHRRGASSASTTGNYPSHEGVFRLKLSGDPIDESRIGKISPEERALLLAKQKLLDADDQTASFLAMQHQVKMLQDELSQIKLQLAQLGINPNVTAASATPPAAVASASSVAPSAAAGSAQANRPKPAVAVKQPVVQQETPDQYRLIIALVLVLIILALWLGLRHYTKIKSRIGIRSHQYDEPFLNEVKVADNLPVAAKLGMSRQQSAPTAPAPVSAQPIQPSQPQSNPAPAITAQTKTNVVKSVDAPPPPPKIEEEVSEEDSMLEEAGLYAAHGRPAKAAEILLEIIKQRPSKAEAWPLLFSIYSSLGKAAEFEKTAKEFLIHHKDSPSWRGIQALGRTLDQNNPLYIDNNSTASASPLLPDAAHARRPVGDVLLDMGVLSKQDLQNCLDDFDPKKHGRFGGYLVARKVITLAQLDQALLQQQGLHKEEKAGSLPSLQDMENFLADFDPKRDGSVAEFLASRNAVTPGQLSQLLQRQTSQVSAAETAPANKPLPVDKEAAMDFEFETTSKLPTLDLEFEPSTGQSLPLDLEVESASPASPASPELNLDFPEINFDLANDNLSGKKPGKQ